MVKLFRRDSVLEQRQYEHIVDMRLAPFGDGIAPLLLLRAFSDKRLVTAKTMQKAAAVWSTSTSTRRRLPPPTASGTQSSPVGTRWSRGAVLVPPSGTSRACG